ncbi:PhnD/SsuA/transferrin family substrate-binding protein [Aquibium sp. ELW1220]|uniref:phosphate/phosphite/phosphonate ABC transporter substrate-binding protein n=1 Tax=Aquibium sp. ELW1220 TaxID=2976766 RepID=UPI0025B0C5DE|nr:PhnD/SsuA/transferrin family substrate-binding protein [Aquibium sp. ELW1220]MDN2578897.1 PhnD/SsuA/transferrin family substrate-binding protein [Aquibium sp. ELW1220]
MLTKTASLAAGAALVLLLWAQSGTAQTGDALSILRIGMVAQPPAGNLVDGAVLIEKVFSDATGLPTQIFVARDYAALIDAQSRGRIDYGVFSATAYATARRVCSCLEAIVAPIGTDGSTGMRAVLIRRKDGNGTGGIAVVPGDATGWLASVEPGPETAGRLVEAATATDAENMLASGEADGMIGWVPFRPGTAPEGGTLSRLAAAGVPEENLLVNWQSEPLRYGPHAVRADMPAETRAALVRFLTGLHDARPDVLQHLEPMRQGGFVRVSDDDYAVARAMVDRVAEGGTR